MSSQKYKITRLNYFKSQNRFIGKNFFDKFYSKSRVFNCSFSKAKFHNINFKGAIITSCSFKQASLKGIDFLGTNLKKCNFSNAYLENIIFVGVKLDECNFKNAKFKNVIFVNTNLKNVNNLDISNGVEILNRYPKLNLSNEFYIAIDDLRENLHLFRTKVLHLPNRRYNQLNILLLLRKYSEEELIKALRDAKGCIKRDIYTYYSLEKELKKIINFSKI